VIVSSRLKVQSFAFSNVHVVPERLFVRWLICIACLLACLVSAQTSLGQDPDKTSKNAETNQLVESPKEPKKTNLFSVPDDLPVTGIQSVLGDQAFRPDAIYLRRENGDAVFVPQLRYEDFERYLNQQTSQSPSNVPAAVFESISATG